MIKLRTIVCLLSGLVIAGCTKAPEYVRPEHALPQQWVQSDSSGPEKIAARKVGWRHFFRDPRLQALIAAGLTHNHDLRVAAIRVDEARAQLGVSEADRYPTLALNASRTASGTPQSVTGAPGETLYRRVDLVNSLSYEFDFWGKFSSLSDAARSNLIAAEESKRAIRLTLIGTIANLYFNMIELDESISLTKAGISNRQSAMELVAKAVDRGAASKVELLQAESALEQMKSQLPVLEAQRSGMLNLIRFLVGSDLNGLPVGLPLDERQLGQEFSTGIPSDVILVRPDVMSAEQRLIAANANIGAARAAFLPRIALTAGLGLASRSLLSLFDIGGRTWNFMPSVSTPVFDGGRLAGSLELAELRKSLAVVEYEKTIEQAFREIADLLAQRASYLELIRSGEASVKIAQARFLVAEARYATGAGSYMEVLDALRERYLAERSLVQLRRAQLSTISQLYKALGGGDVE